MFVRYEGFLSSARFIDDDSVLTGTKRIGWKVLSSQNVNFSCQFVLSHIYPCAGSGDMKVMQFKVETGQKVLDLKVDSSNYWI